MLGGEEAERWGFFNRLASPDTVLAQAQQLAAELAAGPTFANGMTKRMLEMEWAMSVESAIEAEAVAQALCMETEDFARAFRAFAANRSWCSRATEMDLDETRAGHFSTTATAASRRRSHAGPTPLSPRCPTTTSMRRAGPGSRRWRTPVFSRRVVPAEHGGLHRRRANVAWPAKPRLAIGLADFAFAMQGLGTGSISLFWLGGVLQARYLPPVRDGRAIAAFALSEPEAGSDVAALGDDRNATGRRICASTA